MEEKNIYNNQNEMIVQNTKKKVCKLIVCIEKKREREREKERERERERERKKKDKYK